MLQWYFPICYVKCMLLPVILRTEGNFCACTLMCHSWELCPSLVTSLLIKAKCELIGRNRYYFSGKH